MVKVVFLHPDLGIGGAERLVVDAALALKSEGHDVQFLTCHHDADHCFEETSDGTLGVTCVGDWLPRSTFGLFRAFWAYVRVVFAAIHLVAFPADVLRGAEVVVCDQVSACVPFLRFGPNRPRKVVFYCHYPDQLLTDRVSCLKRFYRAPLDFVEEVTTGMADKVLVNSKFTAGVFRDTFKRLAHVEVEVVYPTLHTKMFDEMEARGVRKPEGRRFTFLSVNRYERKKNLPLAIKSLKRLQVNYDIDADLIVIGGYDKRVPENVEHLKELQDLVSELGLEDRVTFKTSTPTEEKVELMMTCDGLIYTPSGEHFGIVPVEAMYSRLPVIAVNNGGPLETVADGETGFLREPTEDQFSQAMRDFVEAGNLREMGNKGRERVSNLFSFQSFAKKLNSIVTQ